ETGEHRRAIPFLEQALAMDREMDDAGKYGLSLITRGTVHLILNEAAQARARYEESLQVRERIGDKHGVAMSLHYLARAAAREGALVDDVRYAERSLALLQQTSDPVRLGAHHAYLGLAYVEAGQLPAALQQILNHLDHIATFGRDVVPGLNHLVIALVL